MEAQVSEVPAPAGTPPPSRRVAPAGLFLCGLLAIVWGWWAWQEGAYFGVVLLPGGLVLCAGLALLARLAPWHGDLRPRGPAAIALVSLGALGIWATLSALWSPAPASAIADGQQILIYAVAFGLGLWLADLLGPRRRLALVPLAAGAGFAGVIVMLAFLTGDQPADFLYRDGTLEFPLGYRNANAAFFLIAVFPALGLASDSQLDWRARGAALGAATLCIEVALLSQSRGSIPAAAIAIGVYVLAAPLRLRAIAWLGLAAVCALGMLPALGDLYSAANDEGLQAAVGEMRAAGAALAVTAAIAAVIAAALARMEGRVPAFGSTRPDANRAIALGLAGVIALGFVGFVIRVGNPVDWVGERAEEFRTGGAFEPTDTSSRFSVNLVSDRRDLWKVALDDASEAPLVGKGAGAYQFTYTREREAEMQNARDAHSIELETLSELGLVGLALLVIILVSVGIGLLSGRRRGPPTDALAAIATASGTYWLTHASIDWFFHYPAVSAPVIALLGSACLVDSRVAPGPPGRGRVWIVAGAVALALTLIPPFLSERYVNDAYAGWRSDPERAYDDLDRAASLHPFSDAPLLAKGVIAQSAGDPELAIEALEDAAQRVSDEWGTHYLLAELYFETGDVELARQELEVARDLNPLEAQIQTLERTLDRPRGGA